MVQSWDSGGPIPWGDGVAWQEPESRAGGLRRAVSVGPESLGCCARFVKKFPVGASLMGPWVAGKE